MLPGLDRNKVEDSLIKAFQTADGASAGVLPMAAISEAVAGAGLNLTPKQVQALTTAGVEGEGSVGAVDYNKVVDVAWDLLVLVARETYVSDKLATL